MAKGRLIALDAALGALIGPGNLWLMSQLVRSERTRQWLAFGRNALLIRARSALPARPL